MLMAVMVFGLCCILYLSVIRKVVEALLSRYIYIQTPLQGLSLKVTGNHSSES